MRLLRGWGGLRLMREFGLSYFLNHFLTFSLVFVSVLVVVIY